MNKIFLLQSFIKSPADVGSIIPSSKFMVKKMINCAAQNNPVTIVELGAGTGVVTKELTKLNTQFRSFEKDNHLRNQLSDEFPDVEFSADAFDMPEMMSQWGKSEIDCVVCGLPFTLFPKQKREELLEMIHSYVAPGGDFVMYQYTLHMKKFLEELYSNVETHFIPLNIPPAFVYHCKK